VSTYLIEREPTPEEAARPDGRRKWPTIAVLQMHPPTDRWAFDRFMRRHPQIRAWIPGRFMLIRTQALGESPGYHPVAMVYLDELPGESYIVRKYGEVRGVPSLPPSRDFLFKRAHRTRFRRPR